MAAPRDRTREPVPGLDALVLRPLIVLEGDWFDPSYAHQTPPDLREPGDGTITNVNVWDSPAAVGEFYLERVRAIVEADGEPEHKPIRHGEPVHVYVRCEQQGT